MPTEFNKTLFFNNISHLIKVQGLKVGEIENNAGVSVGYISRTSKDEKTKPSIEFVMKVAELLHINIDTLLRVDLKKITPTENYIIEFLNKLISDTNDDKLFWELETKESLERIDMGGKIKHSLFTLPIETDKKKFGSAQPTFLSKNFQWFTAIAGNCYKLQLKNGSNLFLMKICNTPIMTSSPRNSTIEIWITMKNKKAEFISDTMGENVTSRLTEILYTAVNENAKHPKIDKGIRYIIDAFMEDDWDDDVNDN